MRANNDQLVRKWEKILARQGLGLLDIEQYQEKQSSIVADILDISSPEKFEKYIEYIQNSHNIHIQFEEKSLRITDEKHDEIGFIRPGHYSYHGLEKDSHLESVIHPPFRGKGYGKILYSLFEMYGKIHKNRDFSLPEKEYSHKKSAISLMVKYFGYTPIRKYVDWEWQEVRYLDEYSDDAIDDEIPYTYELEK
ncbi:hypothetical protein BLM37_00870 [Candidatus Gracilibacteria bacterium GN02-873]|nr:hypothetical protein BLM37_00870 [Candidatus Gracilibacteria bacterium GN02-873]